MEVVCPFCRNSRALQKEFLGLVNIPCDCGAVGVINRADSLHLMAVELANIYDVAELSDNDFDTVDPVQIDMGADTGQGMSPMMIQWVRKRPMNAKPQA